MSGFRAQSELLERRRLELGISRPLLAQRSGVSLATVTRILTGGLENSSTANTAAVARELGMELRFEPIADSDDLMHREAEAKAREIVALVQGSSGLEEQAVDPDTIERMVRQTVHELMAGAKGKIWAPL